MEGFRHIRLLVGVVGKVKDRLHISALSKRCDSGKYVPGVVPDDFCLRCKLFHVGSLSLYILYLQLKNFSVLIYFLPVILHRKKYADRSVKNDDDGTEQIDHYDTCGTFSIMLRIKSKCYGKEDQSTGNQGKDSPAFPDLCDKIQIDAADEMKIKQDDKQIGEETHQDI